MNQGPKPKPKPKPRPSSSRSSSSTSRQNKKQADNWLQKYVSFKKQLLLASKQVSLAIGKKNSRNNTRNKSSKKAVVCAELLHILDWNDVLNTDRRQLFIQQKKRNAEIAQLIIEFQMILNIEHKTNSHIRKIEQISNAIETKVTKFKTDNYQSLMELQNGCGILEKDVNVSLEIFEKWELNDSMNAKNANTNTNTNKNKHWNRNRNRNSFKNGLKSSDSHLNLNQGNGRPPKLLIIEKKLFEYGAHGGWDKSDHSSFLKYYIQIANDKELFMKLIEVLPHLSMTEIREHFEWFDMHQRLTDEKRDIIEKWKAQQQSERALKEDATVARNKVAKRNERKQKEAVNRANAQKRQRISQWKKAKLRENESTANAERLRKAAIEKAKRLGNARRLQKKKRLVQERKLNHKLSELMQNNNNNNSKGKKGGLLSKQKPSAVSVRKNKHLISKFQTRDLLLIEKRKHMRSKKDRVESERELKMCDLILKSTPDLCHLQSNDKGNRSRFLNATQSTKGKKNSARNKKHDDEGDNYESKENSPNVNKYTARARTPHVLQTHNVRRTAVPTWRRNIG